MGDKSFSETRNGVCKGGRLKKGELIEKNIFCQFMSLSSGVGSYSAGKWKILEI